MNPVQRYGQTLADYILRKYGNQPHEMQSILQALDPRLPARFSAMAPSIGKRAALAQGIARGFGEEIVGLAQGGSPRALGGFWDALKSAGSGAGDVLKKAGSLACSVATHETAPLLGAAAAGAAGAPPQTGILGAGIAGQICTGGAAGAGAGAGPYPQQQQTPAWVMPAILIGGGLVLVSLLKK